MTVCEMALSPESKPPNAGTTSRGRTDMPFVKITGYMEVEEHELDPNDSTGLTADAYDEFIVGASGRSVGINYLEDITVERDDR